MEAPIRFGAYVGAAVREAARLRPARFLIQADGVDIDIIGLVVLVANCGHIIPGRVGARQPLDPSDGRLDLLVVGGRPCSMGCGAPRRCSGVSASRTAR